MIIGPATLDDSRSILTLQHLAYRSEAAIYDDYTLPPLLETLEDLIARFQNRRFLKAIDGDRLVGSVRAIQEGETCFVERLIVHPDYRRRGIGTDLLNRIETLFPTAGRFELFTGHKSEGNIRLYERLGYRAFRQNRANEKVTLVYMEKTMPQLTIRLDRLELIAATEALLQAEEDVPQFAQHLQAEVPRNWPTPLYDSDARQHFLRVVKENSEAVGWTAWYILLIDQLGKKTLIGAVGACGQPDDEGQIVIGYSLLDQFQGKGYATEALRGFLEFAKRHPSLRKVVADTYPHLMASIRVLEKNGFVRCGSGAEEGTMRFELAVP
ncbi:MAG: GNAT family N-acetyltransferase [Rhodopirellula sp.]|nr:GNAT family N-acetyltransferase [Rhodopirellula sp.]